AEAVAPGGRQDSRPLHRSVLADYAAAARRQSAVRRTALRRNGSLGARSLRRSAHPAGTAHGEVRRRLWPREDLRGYRQGRAGNRAGRAGIVQRACPRAAVALPRRRVDETAEATGGKSRRLIELFGARMPRPISASCRISEFSVFWVLSRSGASKKLRVAGSRRKARAGRKQPCIAAAPMIAQA